MGNPVDETDATSSLRKKDLLNRVAARTSVKRSDVKTVAEATLAVLSEAIAAEEEMNLPGFGKVKVANRKTTPNGTVYTVRIRQPLAGETPLAEPDDNG